MRHFLTAASGFLVGALLGLTLSVGLQYLLQVLVTL